MFSGEKSIDDICDEGEEYSHFSYYEHATSFDPYDDAISNALKLIRKGDEVLEHASKKKKVVTINLQPAGKSTLLAVESSGIYFSTVAGHAIDVVSPASESIHRAAFLISLHSRFGARCFPYQGIRCHPSSPRTPLRLCIAMIGNRSCFMVPSGAWASWRYLIELYRDHFYAGPGSYRDCSRAGSSAYMST